MPRLTDRSIEALRPRGARYEIWDDGRGGFGVRVTPRGVKSFVWVYRFEGKARRLTLGTYPLVSLAEAGVRFAEAKNLLDHGMDPGSKAVSERAAHRNAETVAHLVADYLERYAEPRKRSAGEDRRILHKDVLPRWGSRKVRDITRRDVVVLLNAIVDRGAPIQANRTLTIVRRMFRFAVGQALIEISPCIGIERPSAENEVDRALSEAEIKDLWLALGTASMESNIRRILLLMLITGQRKGEILGMREAELDRGKGLWLIPADRVKSGREHLIPLSALARRIVDEAPANDAGYMFPSSRTGEPYRGQSIDHATRYLFAPRAPLPRKKASVTRPAAEPALRSKMAPFTPHDLRRSAATRMRELGISRGDVKLILNHSDRDVTGRYDRYDGMAEKRRALELWGRHLEQIISGEQAPSNVLELARS